MKINDIWQVGSKSISTNRWSFHFAYYMNNMQTTSGTAYLAGEPRGRASYFETLFIPPIKFIFFIFPIVIIPNTLFLVYLWPIFFLYTWLFPIIYSSLFPLFTYYVYYFMYIYFISRSVTCILSFIKKNILYIGKPLKMHGYVNI